MVPVRTFSNERYETIQTLTSYTNSWRKVTECEYIPYKEMICISTTLYGIIKVSLPAKFFAIEFYIKNNEMRTFILGL